MNDADILVRNSLNRITAISLPPPEAAQHGRQLSVDWAMYYRGKAAHKVARLAGFHTVEIFRCRDSWALEGGIHLWSRLLSSSPISISVQQGRCIHTVASFSDTHASKDSPGLRVIIWGWLFSFVLFYMIILVENNTEKNDFFICWGPSVILATQSLLLSPPLNLCVPAVFSKPLLFADSSVRFHHLLPRRARRAPEFWSPDFNPNAPLIRPRHLSLGLKMSRTNSRIKWLVPLLILKAAEENVSAV